MAQLKISAAQAATLVGLRSLPADWAAGKAAKKAVFAAIHATFGIPADVKLTVEAEDARSPAYLVLKQKGTGLELVGVDGRFSHVAAPAAAQVPPAAPDTGSRFTASSGGLKVIRKADLMDLLRSAYDDGDANDVTIVPFGMPAVPAGGLVLDNQTGDLYFA